MQSLKKMLMNHGEKILLGLVILFCGINVSSRLRVSPYDLTLPNGNVENVDPENYRAKISEVKDVLGSEGNRRSKPQARRVARTLANRIASGAAAFVNLGSEEWFVHVQPSPIGIPQSFREVRAEDGAGVAANIPAEFRTRFGNPQDVSVRAALGQAVISVRDSSSLNFPQPDSRRMLLYRKAIGSPKEGIPPDVRKRMQTSQHALITSSAVASTSSEETVKETSTAAPANPWARARNQTPVAPKPTSVAPRTQAVGIEQYKAKFTQADIDADQELVVLTGNNDGLLLDTAWELVTDAMYVVSVNELTEDDYNYLFTNGLSPDLVEMNPTQLAEYQAAHSENAGKKEAEAAAPVVASQAGSRRQRINVLPTAERAETTESAAENLRARPQSYIFIDKDVKENMIYRYAVVAAVKPQFPSDATVLEQIRSQSWDIYCELVGVDSVGSFAPPQRILAGVLFDEDEDLMSDRNLPTFKKTVFTKSYGVASPHLLDQIKPAYDAGATSGGGRESQNGPAPKTLRNEKNRLTPLGWAYKNLEYCFSDFVASGLVMTPREYDFELQAVTGMPSKTGMPSDPMARVEVFKTTATGDSFSSSFYVRPPELIRQLAARDLLVKDAQGKVIEPVVLLPLVDVYNIPEMLRVRPVQIGGRAYAKRISAGDGDKKGASSARKDMEFSPNWGVIEIRPYKIRQRIFSLDRRGEWKVTSENFLPSPDAADNYYSLIIGEIKVTPGQQRRVRRLYRPLQEKANTDNRRYEYEYIWEFDIYQRALERAKRFGESGN